MSSNQQADNTAKIIIKDHIICSLNKEEKTASVIGADSNDEIYIPSSVNYESKEYPIIDIKKHSFKDKRNISILKFAYNSSVQTIEKDAFVNSSIASISFPASITTFEEGCFNETSFLKQITIDDRNAKYSIIDNKIIVSKSNIEQNDYDCLIFCLQNAKEVTIPNTITSIEPYAFHNSKIEYFEVHTNLVEIKEGAFLGSSIKEIRIPVNSKLRKIGKNAFAFTSIDEIYIPKSLVEIGEGFFGNIYLNRIRVDKKNPNYTNFKEQMILAKSDVNQENFDILFHCYKAKRIINIPDFIKIIQSYSFAQLGFREITFSANSQLQKINEYAFLGGLIRKIVFPKHLRIIGDGAFKQCEYLENIVFPDDSEIEEIGKNSFSKCPIQTFFVPSNLKRIGERAFYECDNLTNIEIPMNSNLQIIEERAFAFTKINKIFIPSNLTELKDGWCNSTTYLNIVEISPKNKKYSLYNKMILGKSNISQKNYDILVFCARNFEGKIKIPSSIEIIAHSAFNECKQLEEINFFDYPKLRIIDKYAFFFSSIKKFNVPPQLTHICERAFSSCEQLRTFYIPMNSKLEIIDNYAFTYSAIENIHFPSHLKFIGHHSFQLCQNLEHVQIPENSKLRSINDFSFNKCKKLESIDIPLNVKIVSIGNYALAESAIQEFSFPHHLVRIGEKAFYNCKKFKLEFPNNSKLEIIEKESFGSLSIESFDLPTSVIQISEYAFINCKNMKRIGIPNNSQLQIIEPDAFSSTMITCFSVPRHVKYINGNAFNQCNNLQIIEFEEESEIKSLYPQDFEGFKLIMVPRNLSHFFENALD